MLLFWVNVMKILIKFVFDLKNVFVNNYMIEMVMINIYK